MPDDGETACSASPPAHAGDPVFQRRQCLRGEDVAAPVIPGHRKAMSPESIGPQTKRWNGFRARRCASPRNDDGENDRADTPSIPPRHTAIGSSR
ncbi:hypothetical protein chiPu_0033279 [Chiloscyllium punctatum]|uniref:Uncharacterized protein n=1 Tax=Chiloscyllium punctatum TaxID=137246 RepID=A0A401U1M7_CHIPU|nr:hypothetical protein [Chiloscyllium punctatum]